MLDRRYAAMCGDDDYAPVAAACGSAEPFRKADHKAKKHPRPRSKHCGGRYALRHEKPSRVLAEMGGAE